MKVKAIFLTIPVFLFTSCCAFIDSCIRESRTKLTFAQSWENSGGRKISDLEYRTPGPYNTYDLFLPPSNSTEKSKHLILFIHGGGWMGGSKEEGEAYCEYFTSEGYVSASINYTLLDGKCTPNIKSINEEVNLSITAIKNKVHELGYPVTDMAIFGFSAGAAQALFYTFTETKDKPAGNYGRSALPIKFLIDWSGPTSFNPDHWTSDAGVYWLLPPIVGLDGTNAGKASLVSKFTGENVTAAMIEDGSAQALWEAVSPVTFVHANIPPIIMCYGRYDGLVANLHQRLLIDAMERKGLNKGENFDTIEFEDSGHGLHSNPNKCDEFKLLAAEYCERYFELNSAS